jgi:hypothetical protein
MANYKELDETLALVKDLVTTEQIQDLLRTRRGHENVRISGENKDQIVHRNLRLAVEQRAIDIEKVFDLIRDAEENGNQHILYYKAKTRDIADALSFDKLAPRFFGPNWATKLENDFPQIKLRPNDFKISDFRQLRKKPRDWILKIYGQITVERLTSEQEPEGTTSLWRKFDYESLRIVLLARWNSPDLLEIRVQRGGDSRRRIEGWHNIVWETLKPHVVRNQFTTWELSQALKNLAAKQASNPAVYNLSDAEVTDKLGNHATFETELETGDLFASSEVRQSLEGFLKAKSDFNGVTLTWLPQKNSTPSKEVRTVLGIRQSQAMRQLVAASSNEIVVQAHCSAEDLDYVTGQLRSFNK